MKILPLLISSALAYDINTEEDGKTFGYGTLYSMVPLWTLMLLLVLLFHWNRSQLLGGFIQLVTFFQFARYVPLMNFSTSVFYGSFWKQIVYFFQAYIYYEDSDVKPYQPHFEYMEIKSVLILYNAQEYFVILLLCLMILTFLPFIQKSLQESKARYSIFFWFVVASCMDLNFYSFLTIQNVDSATHLMIISAILSGICLVNLFVIFCLMVYSAFTNDFKGYFSLFFKEFKKKSVWMHLYYPLSMLKRIIFGILLVFAYEYKYYQCFTMISLELCIILYLLISLPYISLRNTIITICYHLFEIIFLIIPILYEKSYWSQENVNILTLSICWAGFLLIVLRFSLDIVILESERSKVDLNDISIDERSANVITLEPLSHINEADITDSFEYPRNKHLKHESINKPASYLNPNEIKEFSMHTRNNSTDMSMMYPSQRPSVEYRHNPLYQMHLTPELSMENNDIPQIITLAIPEVLDEPVNNSSSPKQSLMQNRLKKIKTFNLNNLTVKN
ncbi:unnamed protein product [Blepharisma stoltei]|uniref:Uncharacterized protein n=1 Tax=Blepharisma stoltei TaxID=1481888 RepID=A0AAU9JSB9_9CILI|nr:unnamed protein product [Blepharisma stoltei]